MQLLKFFFFIERGTDLQGKPYCYLKNAPSFSSAFFSAITGMFEAGLVTIDTPYERKKAGCCGYTESKDEIVSLPKQLSGIQKIGLTDRAFSVG